MCEVSTAIFQAVQVIGIVTSLAVSVMAYKKASEPEKEKNALKMHLGEDVLLETKTEDGGKYPETVRVDEITNHLIFTSRKQSEREERIKKVYYLGNIISIRKANN